MKVVSRKKKFIFTTQASLLFQIVSIISGFILPRLILQNYGSDVNGLVSSITHFLAIISLLDLGVGEVVRSSLYKPLAKNDYEQISRVVVSGEKFFRKIARILLIYVIVLIFIFLFLIKSDFGHIYTATLIVSISISSFAQYYYGVVNGILLSADQKGYIFYYLQVATLILNVIVCVILMQFGQSIQMVKLATSLIYLLRPLALRLYVNKHYAIDRSINLIDEPIKQKWNGMAQHIATVVLSHTDTIVLTLFATISEVSVYSIYHYVVYGVKNMFDAMTIGIKPLLGELWAKRKEDNIELINTFSWLEWGIHTMAVFVFGCTMNLIIPFIQVYTKGITDVNYILPTFGILLTVAYAVYCIRLPYNMMILAAGHFKQTQKYYIIATSINVVVSILLVNWYGLIGVAIGTLAAMIFHTIWTVVYNAKHIMHRSIKLFLKQIIIDIVTILIGVSVAGIFNLANIRYIDWGIMAVKVALVWGIIIILINTIFYGKYLKIILQKLQIGLKR